MHSSLANSGLNDAGKLWLTRSVSLPTQQLHISQCSRELARTFGLSTKEALLALCATFSIAVGSGCRVWDPFGRSIPLSLQILTNSSRSAALDLAIDSLGHRLSTTLTGAFGRRRPPNDLGLPEEESRLEKYKNSIFPYGSILSLHLAEQLIREDKDCTFASLSNSTALNAFSKIPKDRQIEYDHFITSGWTGNAVAGILSHPIFPMVSLIWSAPSQTVSQNLSQGLLERLPGLLIASRMSFLSDISTPEPLPNTFLEEWRRYIIHIIVKLRATSEPRHISRKSSSQKKLEADAAMAIAETADYVRLYTSGSGLATQLLRQAPIHIVKLAALLSLAPISEAPVTQLEVHYAKEIYRWLVASTIQASEEATRAQPGSLWNEGEIVKNKLTLFGALTIKQIVSERPRQDPAKVHCILREMVDNKSVAIEGDKFVLQSRGTAIADNPTGVS